MYAYDAKEAENDEDELSKHETRNANAGADVFIVGLALEFCLVVVFGLPVPPQSRPADFFPRAPAFPQKQKGIYRGWRALSSRYKLV